MRKRISKRRRDLNARKVFLERKAKALKAVNDRRAPKRYRSDSSLSFM